jgi:ubiquitin related modifier 1
MELTGCSGGLEMLFSNERKLSLSIPVQDDVGAPVNVAFLVQHLCENVMKDPRKDMFVLDGTVCVQNPPASASSNIKPRY